MVESIALKCSCGQMQGTLDHVVPGKGYRFVCLCDDCQAFAHFLGQGRRFLDQQGGTEIFPAVPAHLKFTKGLENLQAVRLTDKGMLRWYAGCCRTPIANTGPTPTMPYVGLLRSFMSDAGNPGKLESVLGPLRVRVQSQCGIPPLAENSHKGIPFRVLLEILKFLLLARLKGGQKPSPFFTEKTDRPLVTPSILTPAARENLRKFCGPHPSAV